MLSPLAAAARRRPVLSLSLFVVSLIVFILYWRSVEHEDLFIVVGGHPWTLGIVWRKLTGDYSFPPPADGSPRFPRGLPHIDHVYVVHFIKEVERREMLEKVLTNHLGLPAELPSRTDASKMIPYYEFRGEWDSHNILEPDSLSILSKHMFSTATEIKARNAIGVAGKLKDEHDGYAHATLPWEPISHSLLIRMANWMQHYTSWVEMSQRDDQVLMVLENDAVLVEGFGEQLEQLWPEPRSHPVIVRVVFKIPVDFDIVYIGSCLGRHGYSYTDGPGGGGFVREINSHIYQMNHHRCASGYILSRKGVEILLHAPPMIGMDNIDEWMQFAMGGAAPIFRAVYWLEPVLSYEGTKSFLLPTFCSPRTSWFGCDPFWRPILLGFSIALGLASMACALAIFICGLPAVWQARGKRCLALCGIRTEVRYAAVPMHSPTGRV